MWNPFKRQSAEPRIVTVTPQPVERPRVQLPNSVFVRKGMWAVHNGVVGILNEWYMDGTCDFHVVSSPQGYTVEKRRVPTEELVQARYEDIPEHRRPDVEYAHKLGYM